jgi:hypothetical protein
MQFESVGETEQEVASFSGVVAEVGNISGTIIVNTNTNTNANTNANVNPNTDTVTDTGTDTDTDTITTSNNTDTGLSSLRQTHCISLLRCRRLLWWPAVTCLVAGSDVFDGRK